MERRVRWKLHAWCEVGEKPETISGAYLSLYSTDFVILLSQAQSDRTILAKQFGTSEHQFPYITHSNSDEGLLFYGNVTILFADRFPEGKIYNLLTTRPEDVKDEMKIE